MVLGGRGVLEGLETGRKGASCSGFWLAGWVAGRTT